MQTAEAGQEFRAKVLTGGEKFKVLHAILWKN